MSTAEFQRARRPEQVAARRQRILTATRELLGAQRSHDVSLGDISGATGLAKSALLRYFDSREAVFLEVLDAEWRAWLDALTADFPLARPGRWDTEREIAGLLARSLSARPLLCDLLSVMAGVLEHNISLEFARDFKQRAADSTERLADLVARALPRLPATACHQYAGAVVVIIAGLWPYARPNEVVATVSAEMGLVDTEAAFLANLEAGLRAQLIGLSAQLDG
jgi:AcrR family transcriptional regulator